MTKISRLTLFKEIIAVCSESHMKHVNTLCGQNVELLNVKAGGTYSYHCALTEWHIFCSGGKPFIQSVSNMCMMTFFWVESSCGLVGISRRFGEAFCLHLQGWSECLTRPDWPFLSPSPIYAVSLSFCSSFQPWRWRQHSSPKHRLLPTSPNRPENFKSHKTLCGRLGGCQAKLPLRSEVLRCLSRLVVFLRSPSECRVSATNRMLNALCIR
jgi:hypothetical protein